MTSGPLVALVLSGDQVIEVVRALIGATDGRKAPPGTIRGDLSLSNRENLVHASDSAESAEARDRALVPRAGLAAPAEPAAGAATRTAPTGSWGVIRVRASGRPVSLSRQATTRPSPVSLRKNGPPRPQ